MPELLKGKRFLSDGFQITLNDWQIIILVFEKQFIEKWNKRVMQDKDNALL